MVWCALAVWPPMPSAAVQLYDLTPEASAAQFCSAPSMTMATDTLWQEAVPLVDVPAKVIVL